jgi:uncharacterized DUF497 family protein
MLEFRWNAWNIEHIAEHGILAGEAEYVADHARPPYPQVIGDGKWVVIGQTRSGRYLQVIYIDDDDADTVYVIHARDLTDSEKRRFRRRTK